MKIVMLDVRGKMKYPTKDYCNLWIRSGPLLCKDLWSAMKPHNTNPKPTIQLLESPCSLVRPLVTKFDHIFNGRSSSSSSSEQTLLTQLGLRMYTIQLDTCITLWIHASWTHLRGSHGLSARRAWRPKSRGPEGLQTRSLGPEGP